MKHIYLDKAHLIDRLLCNLTCKQMLHIVATYLLTALPFAIELM